MSTPLVTRPGQTPSAAGRLVSPSDHQIITKAARGVPDRAATTLSFDAGTRTFTITPTSGAWSYYQAGRRHIKSAAESIVIADTGGPHWIYYDGGTLSSVVNADHDTVDDLIVNKVRIGIVYWNATDGVGHLVADERHGTEMSGATQEWYHDTVGAVWHDGLALSGYTLDTDSDAGVDFEVTDGSIRDEDLVLSVVDGAPATQYAQQLNGGNAEVPIAYRDDVDGTWTQDAATTLPYKRFGAGRLAYNKDDGDGTWSQVEVTNNRFVLATLVATNDWQYPIKMVQGQAEYTDKKTAIEEANAEQVAWGTMLTPEIVPLYRLVMETGDGLGGTNKCKIVAVTDLRRLSVSGGLATPAEPHAILNGATHSDSVAAAVTAGALLYGNATPEWAKHALVTLDAAGVMSGLTQVNVDNLRLDGNAISNTGGSNVKISPLGANSVHIDVTGVPTSNMNAVLLTNSAWHGAMTDTRTSFSFWQAYNVGGDLWASGQVTVGTETNWSAVAATQDSYMAFYTTLNSIISEKVRINSAGAVGINTDEPGGLTASAMLDIRKDALVGFGIYSFNADNVNHDARLYAGRARGVDGTPVIVNNGDRLFTFQSFGWDGAAFKTGAVIVFAVDGVPGVGSMPTSISLRSGAAAAVERMRIQSDGDILVDSGTSLFIRDSQIALSSSLDGQLDIDADGTVDIVAPIIRLSASTWVSLVGSVDVYNATGFDYYPLADVDVDIATVHVDGTPILKWDESEDAFAMTHRLSLPEGVQTKYATDDVSDPPTDAELDAAFGDPTVVGSGFVGILDDNGAGLYCYICWTTGTAGEWFYVAGTKAV